jgi:hypothetical protein
MRGRHVGPFQSSLGVTTPTPARDRGAHDRHSHRHHWPCVGYLGRC